MQTQNNNFARQVQDDLNELNSNPVDCLSNKVDLKILKTTPVYNGNTAVFNLMILIWRSESEYNVVKQMFGPLAEAGVIVAIARNAYQELRLRYGRSARNYIKLMTAHNQKLGLNYSTQNRRYQLAITNQFSVSNYSEFVKKAAQLYGDTSQGKHFKSLIESFNINEQEMKSKPNAQKEIPFYEMQLPDKDYERKIEGYVQQIESLKRQLESEEEEADELQLQVNNLERQVEGYTSKAMMEPKVLVNYPELFRKNLLYIFKQLEINDEVQYVRSLAEPFHPSVQGVRVPMLIPRDTVTYNNYREKQISFTSTAQKVVYLTNFESQSSQQSCTFIGNSASNLLTGSPSEGVYTRKGVNYKLHALQLGIASNFFDEVKVQTNQSLKNYFTKSRTVAAGVRIMKTSVNENESGTLSMVYNRDGAAFDATTPLQQELNKPRNDRCQLYLAGSGKELCRGKVGFVGQTNFRPFDEGSYGFADDNDKEYTSDRRGMNFAGESSPFWFYQEKAEGGAIWEILKYEELDINGGAIGLLFETIQQRHTFMSIFQDVSAGMTLSIERMGHYEGLPDQQSHGFAVAQACELTTASSPLQLISTYNLEYIFGDYSMRRDALLEAVIQGKHVEGFWKETVFPTLRKLISYGADQVVDYANKNSMVDAAVDTASATLAAMAPEFMPLILASKEHIKPLLQAKTKEAVNAIKQWSQK